MSNRSLSAVNAFDATATVGAGELERRVRPAPAGPPGRKLVKDGAWALLGKVWVGGSGILIGAMWSRVLTKEAFGEFSLANNVLQYGSTVGALGLNILVIRLVAEHVSSGRRGEARNIIVRCLLVAMLASLLFGGLYAAVSPWLIGQFVHSPELAAVSVGMAVWMVLQAVTMVLAESFRGYRDIRSSVLFGGAVFCALYLGVAGISWRAHESLTLSVVVSWAVICAAVNLLIASVFLWRRADSAGEDEEHLAQGYSHPHVLKGTYSALLVEGVPMMINLVFVLLMNNLDMWLVGHYCKDELPLYGAVSRLMLIIGLPLAAVNSVIPPMIAELNSAGRKETLEQLLRRSATLAGLPTLAVLLVLMLISKTFLVLLYGDPFYAAAAPILLILCVGQVIFTWGGSANFVLMMTGYQGLGVLAGLLSLVMLVVGGILLAEPYGATGVAAAAAASAAFYKILLAVLVRRILGIRTWIDFSRSSLVDLVGFARRLFRGRGA